MKESTVPRSPVCCVAIYGGPNLLLAKMTGWAPSTAESGGEVQLWVKTENSKEFRGNQIFAVCIYTADSIRVFQGTDATFLSFL
jgi:hypothetical protein